MRFICKTTIAAGILGIALTAGAASTWSADMTKAIAFRQNVMKAIGSSTADIGLMLKGEVPFDAKQVVAFAQTINTLSKLIPDLVPAGSGPEAGETNAKIEIWQKLDDFKKAAGTLTTESAKLIEVAQAGDPKAIGEQTGVMGKQGCGGCHTPFRKPLQ